MLAYETVTMANTLIKSQCPTLDLLQLIGKAWTSVIILELFYHGPQSFNQLASAISRISSKELSAKLHLLEADKIIERSSAYALTQKGRELGGIIREFKEFHQRWHLELPASCREQSCAACLQYALKYPV